MQSAPLIGNSLRIYPSKWDPKALPGLWFANWTLVQYPLAAGFCHTPRPLTEVRGLSKCREATERQYDLVCTGLRILTDRHKNQL